MRDLGVASQAFQRGADERLMRDNSTVGLALDPVAFIVGLVRRFRGFRLSSTSLLDICSETGAVAQLSRRAGERGR